MNWLFWEEFPADVFAAVDHTLVKAVFHRNTTLGEPLLMHRLVGYVNDEVASEPPAA